MRWFHRTYFSSHTYCSVMKILVLNWKFRFGRLYSKLTSPSKVLFSKIIHSFIQINTLFFFSIHQYFFHIFIHHLLDYKCTIQLTIYKYNIILEWLPYLFFNKQPLHHKPYPAHCPAFKRKNCVFVY